MQVKSNERELNQVGSSEIEGIWLETSKYQVKLREIEVNRMRSSKVEQILVEWR